MTSEILAACAGFLLAVLWMDLMFDVQVLRHHGGELPEEVLASIAAYYRRVTTTASPMGHLVAMVMATTIVGSIVQIAGSLSWTSIASLPFACGPIGLALARVVRNAVRLGGRNDSLAEQSALARSICRDHLFCFGGILAFLVLQLCVARS